MLMILIGFFQGALLFAGLSLAFNTVAFTSTNWGFIFLLTLIGAVLGALVGIFMRDAEPANSWAIPLGSILVAIVIGILAMAFDFFIFGSEKMHWRGIFALALISSAPGMVVGWVLAQQFSEGAPSSRPSPSNRSVRPSPAARREPLPEMRTSSDFQNVQQQQLERLLQAEIERFPSGVQVVPPQPVGASGNMCVTATLNGRGQTLKIYLVCTPDYPNEAPQLLVEQIDRLQGEAGREVQYHSQVIRQWGAGNQLYQVVDEIYQHFTGR